MLGIAGRFFTFAIHYDDKSRSSSIAATDGAGDARVQRAADTIAARPSSCLSTDLTDCTESRFANAMRSSDVDLDGSDVGMRA